MVADDGERDGEGDGAGKEEGDRGGEEDDGARGGSGRGARVALARGADGRVALHGVERGVLAEAHRVRVREAAHGLEARRRAVVVHEHDARVLVHAAVAPEPVARRAQHRVAAAEHRRHVRRDEGLKLLGRHNAPVRHRQPKEQLRPAPRPPRRPAKRQACPCRCRNGKACCRTQHKGSKKKRCPHL